MGGYRVIAALAGALFACLAAAAAGEPLGREQIARYVAPPMELGERLNDKGVWQLLNSGGAEAGFVFETESMAPIPGFSGAPINALVVLDLDGRFLDVKLIEHNEPIFVSGLGEAPFRKFFEQYRGHSISETLVVGTPYGDATEGSALVYLDGVTKATASVRIAHESILAATLQVAREKMQGISTGPPAFPDPEYSEDLDWEALVDQGLVTRRTVLNREVNDAFAGTVWEDDDPQAQAEPDGVYLDLLVADLGPPAIARTLLAPETYEELQRFMGISTSDEPILLVDAGRHGLVSDDFVRNTSPDWISAEQDGFPVALRDADLFVTLSDQVPEKYRDGTAMILRTDRRLGFDPTREWTLQLEAVREHGMFMPEVGSVRLAASHVTDARFFDRIDPVRSVPPWLGAAQERAPDLVALGVMLAALLLVLGPGMNRLADHRRFTAIRLGVLAVVTGFIGWWGQGQLSVVTPLATLRAAIEGGSFAFLLYDPFSLMIWAVTILGFVAWGRGLFCGWLCPFGALQEFAHHLGRLLRVPQVDPSAAWDARLKWLKYAVLAGLVAVLFAAPAQFDAAVEVEPFKTAITTYFVRDWTYVAYAVFWLLLGMMLFKGFCRYVCPLGALMAIGGLLRGRDWIDRRAECGSPCQLCKVRCKYGAIERSGRIDYSECFQCLDCVAIHNDAETCVPLVNAAKRGRRMVAAQ